MVSEDPSEITKGAQKSFRDNLADKVNAFVLGPGDLFREYVQKPLQSGNNKTYYYHRKYRRVPNIDTCLPSDFVCKYEANEQMRRDEKVDLAIISILRDRLHECEVYHGSHDFYERCGQEIKDFENASTDYFIKFGDLGVTRSARDAYMKQKHRMVWERRHGKVGTGVKVQPTE